MCINIAKDCLSILPNPVYSLISFLNHFLRHIFSLLDNFLFF